jgi:hypothetical protein
MDSLDAVVTRNPNKIIKVANSEAIFKSYKRKIAAMFELKAVT